MIHWLFVTSGLSSPSGPWYLFWSGIGADWTRLLTLGGVITLVRQRTVHHRELKNMHERHHRELIRGVGGTQHPDPPPG